MDLARLSLVICLVPYFEWTLAHDINLSLELKSTFLILDILRILVLLPPDQHVNLILDRVHVLYLGWLQTNVVLVQKLALRLWVLHATQLHEGIFGLFLPLADSFGAKFKCCVACASNSPHEIGHHLSICLVKALLLIHGLLLIEHIWLLCDQTTLLFESAWLRLLGLHLGWGCRSKVNVCDLVLVLILSR